MSFFEFSLYLNGYPIFMFGWNAFLALIPCVIVFWLQKHPKTKILPLLFGFWLFFLPNTSYLLTESRHLIDLCNDGGVYDVCREESWVVMVFFLYSLVGVPMFVYALRGMTNILTKRIHPAFSTWFPVAMIPAVSIGTLLGLVERFNSWEILTQPLRIFSTGFGYLLDPPMLLNVVVFSVILAVVYYATVWLGSRAHTLL